MPTTKDLARTILGLTYGDLMEVGQSLADAVRDKDARPQPETAQDFASLLHDWADGVE